MLGSASDFTEQVRAGQLRVIAVVGPSVSQPSPTSAPPRSRASSSSKVPVQFRAVMGAPDMPEDAVQGFQDDFSKMVETEDWKAIAKESGLVTENLQDEALSSLPEGTDHHRR